MDIITNLLQQLVFTVGVIFLFGFIIAFCRRTFCRLLGESGPKILLATGFIGTPVHELGHALMCILFGHKIVEMKLFDPHNEDGTLGYVQHSYNPKNIYHKIGNFFIGVAPILCGSGVLILLLRLMVPDAFDDAMGIVVDGGVMAINGFDFDILGDFVEMFWEIVKIVFDFSNADSILWWLFIILALMISSHMELSGADIKGGLGGLGVIVAILAILDVALYFINVEILYTVTEAMTSFGGLLAAFLAISAVFALALLAIAGIVVGIKKVIKK